MSGLTFVLLGLVFQVIVIYSAGWVVADVMKKRFSKILSDSESELGRVSSEKSELLASVNFWMKSASNHLDALLEARKQASELRNQLHELKKENVDLLMRLRELLK